jgi:hypothetical protein
MSRETVRGLSFASLGAVLLQQLEENSRLLDRVRTSMCRLC